MADGESESPNLEPAARHCRLCRGRVNTPESVMTGVTPQCCPGMFIDVTAPVSSWTRVILANIWLGTALTMVIYLSICIINVMLIFPATSHPGPGTRNWFILGVTITAIFKLQTSHNSNKSQIVQRSNKNISNHS